MKTSVMLAPLSVAAILLVVLVTLAQCDPRKARLRNSWWSKKSVAAPRPPADQTISRHLGDEGTPALPGGVPEEEEAEAAAAAAAALGEASLGPVDSSYVPRFADDSQGSEDLLFFPRPELGRDDDGGDDDVSDGMYLGEMFSPYIRSRQLHLRQAPRASGCKPALPSALGILSRLHAHLTARHHPHAQAILLARLQSLGSQRPLPGQNPHVNSDPALTWGNNRSQQ